MSGRPPVGFGAQSLLMPPSGTRTYVRGLLAAMAAMAPPPDLRLFYSGRRRLTEFAATWPRRRLPLPVRWRDAVAVRGPLRIETVIGPCRLVHVPDLVPVRTVAPLVVTLHDLVVFRMPELFPELWHPERLPGLLEHQRATRTAIARAAHFICVSESTRRDLLELFGVEPGRTTVIPHGAPHPPPGFSRRPSPDGPRRVLFVGNPEHRKNLPAAVAAVAKLRDGGLETELIVCGDDDNYWSAGVRAEAARPWVRWLGPLSEDALWAEYATAHALLYPSWYEGFGLPPLEAMAAGLPVVASRTSSLTELLEGAALLCDPALPRAFAAALGRVLTEPELTAGLVAEGRRRAAALTWSGAAERTLEVYERVA